MFPGHANRPTAPTCVAAPVGFAGKGVVTRVQVAGAGAGLEIKLRLTAWVIASTLMSTKRLFLALPNKPSASSGQGLRVLPRVALM